MLLQCHLCGMLIARLVFIEDGGITTVEMASVAFVLDMTVYESVDVK